MVKKHVVPINDLKEHIVDDLKCWCRPRIDDEDPDLIVHNSLDRREEYENTVH